MDYNRLVEKALLYSISAFARGKEKKFKAIKLAVNDLLENPPLDVQNAGRKPQT